MEGKTIRNIRLLAQTCRRQSRNKEGREAAVEIMEICNVLLKPLDETPAEEVTPPSEDLFRSTEGGGDEAA